jgi:hypothetical protein
MAIIYWIHYPEHKDPLNEGYVGITDDFERRIIEHKKTAIKNPKSPKDEALAGPRSDEIIVELIFEGTPAECATEEYRLRPKKNIGWNILYGGTYNKRTAMEKLERRFKQGRLAKHQYEREVALLIGKSV